MASLALAFDILARDKGASRTLNDVGDAAERTGQKGEGLGSKLGAGLKVGALAAAAGIATATVSLVGFVGEAKESQRIGKLTEAVLKSTGGVAGISADGVDKLATALSNKSAVDDELIANSANVLLTFTKVRNEAGAGNDIFNQGAEAALNMATALDTDLQGATVQIGKALNDPIKGVSALAKAGVGFTEQQKEQIRTLVESGDVLGAQKIILEELGTQFGGAAEAAASPLDRLKVVAGNLGEQVGGLLLPTVERFATYIGETVAPRVAELIDGFENGTGAGGRLRTGFEDVHAGAVIAFDFFKTDVLPRLVEFRDFVRDEVVPRVAEFADYIRDDLVPQIRDLRDRFQQDVMPRLREIADYLAETFQPTWEKLVDLYEDKLKPGIDRITEAFERNEPQLRKVYEVVGLVAGAVFYLYTQFLSYLYPILITVAGYLIDTVVVAFEKASDAQAFMVDVISDLVEKFQTAKDKVGDFIDKVKNFSTPAWVDDMVDLFKTIADAATDSPIGRILGAFGDAPASVSGTFIGGGGGGPALSRVQSILPAGLSITSTYRSPAHNARVGGSPTSLHMDRDNPAVDIGGPTALLDQFAAQLRAVGGWRQLLWRVSGHYDHIHVAHNGGTVDSSWPSMPGLRSDERPAILQTGERVQSRAELARGGTDTGKHYHFHGTPAEMFGALQQKERLVALRYRSRVGVPA